MKITLTKSKNFHLEPYGRFYFKWDKPKREDLKPHQIHIGELHIKHETSMPLTDEQEKMIVDMMVKNKTDILTDGTHFYTRTNDGLTEIWHDKIMQYGTDPAYKDAVDNATWR